MPFRPTIVTDFIGLESPDLGRSSYKNLGYPLGCSMSELNVALGDGDFLLEDETSGRVGFVRVKAMFEGIAYLDVHLLSENADHAMHELLSSLADDYEVGKYYVQLFPYEQREIACLRRLVFTEEARLRSQYFVDGAYHDILMMGSEDQRV